MDRDRELERTAGRAPAEDAGCYQHLVDGVEDCGLLLLDPMGRILTWSAGAERLTGYRTDEIVGRPIADLQAPRSGDSAPDGAPPDPAPAPEGRSSERRDWVRKDGSRFLADVTTSVLRGQTGEVRGFTCVVRDPAATAGREAELRDQLRRMVEASRRKDELLALLGHQLRNPLSPIRNSLHLLKRGLNDPRITGELYEVMDRQVERLVRIIDDVLEISRMARGRIELETQHADLRQVARQAMDSRRAEADRVGLTLTAALPVGPVWVRGDVRRLRRVVDALLENALRFTGRDGLVTLEVTLDAGRQRAILQVRDSGVGLAPDTLRRMAEALARPDGGPDAGQGELGLGLSLVRGIVDLHGGTVEVRSEGTGRGAEFIVALPVAEPAAVAPAHQPPVRPGSAPHLRILVVEDNPDAAESLRRLLRLHGHEVSVAGNGVDGVAEAKRYHPDAVVCDIGLPGMDGYAVASALRGDPATARTRLIAVTGYGRAEDRARALSSGFDEHIVKPADPELLLSKLAVTAGR